MPIPFQNRIVKSEWKLPSKYPSGEILYAHTGSSFSPYTYYERPMEISRNPLWECSYCKQTNSKESLSCVHCGAGQLRSVKNPLLTADQIFEELRMAFGGTK